MKKSSNKLSEKPILFRNIIVILLIAIICVFGYVVYDRYSDQPVAEQSAVAEDMTSTEAASSEIVIEESSDLDEALQTLDQIDSSSNNDDIETIDSMLSEF